MKGQFYKGNMENLQWNHGTWPLSYNFFVKCHGKVINSKQTHILLLLRRQLTS